MLFFLAYLYLLHREAKFNCTTVQMTDLTTLGIYRAQIQLQIRSAIEQQVAQQVNARISTILPIPLADQARETRRRIEEVKRALENSYVVVSTCRCGNFLFLF